MPITSGIILYPNPCSETSTNSQINLGTTNENKKSKVGAIKIWLNSDASASIVHIDIQHKRNQILKDKKNNWSTIAEFLNTTFVTELKLTLPEFNHTKEIKQNAI